MWGGPGEKPRVAETNHKLFAWLPSKKLTKMMGNRTNYYGINNFLNAANFNSKYRIPLTVLNKVKFLFNYFINS